MNQTDNKIKFFISTSILTFIGLLNLLMVLFLQFDRYVSIEMASGVIFAVVISLVMSALFVFIKRQWIAWIGIIAAGGIVFWIAREAVMGGTAEFINAVINDMAGFFETEMYFIDMSLRLMKEANPDLAINMALCLIGALYAFCFTHKRMAVIPMVISLAFTVLAAIMDKASVAGIVIGIAYSVSLLIMILASWGKSKDRIRYFWVQTACIVCTAAIIAVTMIISAVKPKDDYEKPQYFNDVYSRGEEMYNQFQNGELTINKIIDFVGELLPWDGEIPGQGVGIASGGSSEIGAGELGHVDKLEFSGKEVLQVNMPVVQGKIYIRGYIGADYKKDRWAEPDWAEEKSEAPGIVSDLSYRTLNLLARNGQIKAYETGMNIEYTAGETRYVFIPSHPAQGMGFSMTATEGYGIAEYPFNTTFIHIDEETYAGLDAGISSSDVQADSDYEPIKEFEESYRDMVYDRYLDVNTTQAMKDKFSKDWGGYNIESSAGRYTLACAVRKYLADNCTYTVSPGALPEGEDFVEYFIDKTHKGYCTYFATAAVMMLRSAGVPARYVEGYSFDTSAGHNADGSTPYTEYKVNNGEQFFADKDNVRISVADSAAHAWVQYYVDGIGWVDLDVTPGNYNAPANVSEETKPENTTPVETTADQKETQTTAGETTATAERNTKPSEENRTYNNDSSMGGKKFKLSKTAERVIILVALAAVISALVIFISVIHNKKMVIIRNRMYNGTDESIYPQSVMTIYREYTNILKHFGLKCADTMTQTEFARIVAKKCPFVAASEAERMAELYDKVTFSNENITADDRNQAVHVIASIRKRMKGNMGFIKRFLYRHL